MVEITHTGDTARGGNVATRDELEQAYRNAIAVVRALAAALGKPCPVVSRDERRRQAQ